MSLCCLPSMGKFWSRNRSRQVTGQSTSPVTRTGAEWPIRIPTLEDWPETVTPNKTEDLLQCTVFGLLVDVSGSMENTFDVCSSSRDRDSHMSVERIHAVITSILKIVNAEVSRHNMKDEIFVCAFGLQIENDPETGSDIETNTCDLIALLDLIAGPENLRGEKPHDALIKIANQQGVSYVEKWVREYLSEDDAAELYRVVCFDKSLISELVERIPSENSRTRKVVSFAGSAPGGKLVEGVAVHNSAAYRYAQMLIRDKDKILIRMLKRIQNPESKSIQHVSKLLEDLKISEASVDSSSTLHSRIKELIEPIRPYIFGGTPLCKAMTQALELFQTTRAKSRVLLLLSDGESGDGDPGPIVQNLEEINVTRVSCFLTDIQVDNSRCLLDKASEDWPRNDGRLTLFNVSSSVRNIDPPVSYLVDAGWTLPASGESRLFVQAKSLDVIDELCDIVVSRLTEHCDALIDVLEMVSLTDYINGVNKSFEPKLQKGGTCYANAVAAVFHLAMHRIVGREGGYPEFEKIRERLIQEYGEVSAHTNKVIAEVSPEYRLHWKEVDEVGARQALNHRRPVVATFSLLKEQMDRFTTEFFTRTPKGILTREDIGDGSANLGLRGHAVVLISCTPQCLVFMNSWGQAWGDGGLFRVKDSQCLSNVHFYDVYWKEEDLTQNEKEAYRREGIERAKKLAEKYPSINDLMVECPHCKQRSRVGDFSGDLLEATCPRCNCKFSPTNEDLFKSIYLRSI